MIEDLTDTTGSSFTPESVDVSLTAPCYMHNVGPGTEQCNCALSVM